MFVASKIPSDIPLGLSKIKREQDKIYIFDISTAKPRSTVSRQLLHTKNDKIVTNVIAVMSSIHNPAM